MSDVANNQLLRAVFIFATLLQFTQPLSHVSTSLWKSTKLIHLGKLIEVVDFIQTYLCEFLRLNKFKFPQKVKFFVLIEKCTGKNGVVLHFCEKFCFFYECSV